MKIRTGFVSNSSSSSFIISDTELIKIKKCILNSKKRNNYAVERAHEELKYFWNEEKNFYELFHEFKNEYQEQFYKLQEDVIKNKFSPLSLSKFLNNFKRDNNIYDLENKENIKLEKIVVRDYYDFYNIGDYFKKSKKIRKYILYNLKAQFLKILQKRSFKSLYSWIFGVDFEPYAKLYIGKRFKRDKTKHHMINRHRSYNKYVKERIQRFEKLDRLSNSKKFNHIVNYLISQEFHLLNTWSSHLSWVKKKKDKDLQDIVNFLKLFDILITPLSHKLYQVIIDENKDKKFFVKEYSDGGGCGTTLPLAECGFLFEELGIKYIRISNH